MLVVNETPIAMLTVGQLKEIIASAMPKQEEQPKIEATPTYIYVNKINFPYQKHKKRLFTQSF